MKYLLLTVAICMFSTVFGQRYKSSFSGRNNWTANSKEFNIKVGATQFLGDLGGRDQIGRQRSMADLNWAATRMGIGAGYRLRFAPILSTSTNLYFGLVSGDDAHTNEIIRNSRNLHFRAQIVEFSQRFEIIVLANEMAGSRSGLSRSASRAKADQLYLFTGIGGLFFNPQAQIQGRWQNLQPLNTEGQGLPGGADPYSRFTATVPFGIGFKLGIDKDWRIGLELSYHMTFTDYIDDVSTNYYDPAVLASSVGPESAYASNPAKANHNWFVPGQQRGNPDDNDAFFLANIVLTRNLSSPRGRSRGPRYAGRAKF